MGVPLLALLDDLGPAMLGVDYLKHGAVDLQACSSIGELWSAVLNRLSSRALAERAGGVL